MDSIREGPIGPREQKRPTVPLTKTTVTRNAQPVRTVNRNPVSVVVAALLISIPPSILPPATGQETEHPASGLPIPPSHLTGEDMDLALSIGAGRFVRSGLLERRADRSAAETTVFSGVEMVSDGKPDSRLAIITTYNYERHETTRRLVDLNRKTVVEEHVSSDGSAPLAQVELVAAEHLVLADSRVRELLGSSFDGVQVGFLRTGTTSPDDPLFGKRTVAASFKTERGYLVGLPLVVVNLTDAKVVLE